MMDEQEVLRQQALQGWDEQSCAEFEAFLDEIHDDAQEPAEVLRKHHPSCSEWPEEKPWLDSTL